MTSVAAAVASGGTGQNMGADALAIMSVAIMVCLAAMLIPIFVASRRPGSPRHSDRQVDTSPVLGGMHRGEGRSVAPRRDAPAANEMSGSAIPPERSANR